MFKKIWICLIVCCLSLGFSHKHAFFLSMVEVKQNLKEQNVELSIRIFTDDFENNLAKTHPVLKIDFNNPKNKSINDKLIFDYIKQKLQLTINKTPKTLQYVGFEIQQESIWIYVEVPQSNAIKSLEANCNIMYDFNSKQVNIFKANANGIEHVTKLDFPKTAVNFNW